MSDKETSKAAKRLLGAKIHLAFLNGTLAEKDPEAYHYYQKRLKEEEIKREKGESLDLDITSKAVKRVNDVMEYFSKDEKYMLKHFLDKELESVILSTSDQMELEMLSKAIFKEDVRAVEDRLKAGEVMNDLHKENKLELLKPFLNKSGLECLNYKNTLDSLCSTTDDDYLNIPVKVKENGRWVIRNYADVKREEDAKEKENEQ